VTIPEHCAKDLIGPKPSLVFLAAESRSPTGLPPSANCASPQLEDRWRVIKVFSSFVSSRGESWSRMYKHPGLASGRSRVAFCRRLMCRGNHPQAERAITEQRRGKLQGQRPQRRTSTPPFLAGRVRNFCSSVAFEGVPVLKHKKRLENRRIDRRNACLLPGASIPPHHVMSRPSTRAAGLNTSSFKWRSTLHLVARRPAAD